jgi:hypothetical protein
MSRVCQCSARCRHVVRGGDPLLMPDRLVRLADVLGVLVDSADAFDAESLQFDPACGLHGTRSITNAECVCQGRRYSAAEFIQALMLDVRSAQSRTAPAGRPNAARPHNPRLELVATG